MNQVNFDPNTKTKSFSTPTHQFRYPYKNQGNFDQNIKIRSFLTPKLKPSQFLPFTESKSNSTPHTEVSSIWTTHTKTKSICMLILKILKTSDFQPAYKSPVNFYHPHNNQINSMPTLKSNQVRSPTLIWSQFRPPSQKQVDFRAYT